MEVPYCEMDFPDREMTIVHRSQMHTKGLFSHIHRGFDLIHCPRTSVQRGDFDFHFARAHVRHKMADNYRHPHRVRPRAPCRPDVRGCSLHPLPRVDGCDLFNPRQREGEGSLPPHSGQFCETAPRKSYAHAGHRPRFGAAITHPTCMTRARDSTSQFFPSRSLYRQ